MLHQPLLCRADGDFRRLACGKIENARGNTAESDAFQPFFPCEIETGKIAGFQQASFRFADAERNPRADGMQHVTARQIVGGGDFRAARAFRASLRANNRRTVFPKLKARAGMNDIVDAVMEGNITPRKLPRSGTIASAFSRVMSPA